MWLPNEIVKSVDDVARIHYIDKAMTLHWNAHRREGELRLLTGWCWTSRTGDQHRQGFKTLTIAYRDAWYSLVAKREAPRTKYRAAGKLKIVRPDAKSVAGG